MQSLQKPFTVVEMCAGAGGQSLGLEQAGFEHVALVEIDGNCCKTLRYNRPDWRVIEMDLRDFDGKPYHGADLLAGGIPCPPFSKAGKQLGKDDERNLFPAALRLIEEIKPKAIMIENVRGLLDKVFAEYRDGIEKSIEALGYQVKWKLLNASDYGVSQLRPRVVMIGLSKPLTNLFVWPEKNQMRPPSVGESLYDLIAKNGWPGAKEWKKLASGIAPTVVGGSLKHGGPDLGPTRAKKAWAALGVDGMGIVDHGPGKEFEGSPRLTVRMVARIQGFPDTWQFYGKKTAAYRQVGNAFPPPVAKAVGLQIIQCLAQADKKSSMESYKEASTSAYATPSIHQ